MFRWIIGGVVGGLVGVIIWTLIAYFSNYELGWIAWGVGFLTGLGVRYGVALGGDDDNALEGIVAALISAGAIVTAKFLLFAIVNASIDGEALENASAMAREIRFDDEAMVAEMADEVVAEMQDRGQSIQWPEGSSYEDAFVESDYPANIWQQGKNRWEQLPEDEQRGRKLTRMQMKSMLSSAANSRPEFQDFFSPWDFLWFGLAMFTAFRIGSGVVSE